MCQSESNTALHEEDEDEEEDYRHNERLEQKVEYLGRKMDTLERDIEQGFSKIFGLIQELKNNGGGAGTGTGSGSHVLAEAAGSSSAVASASSIATATALTSTRPPQPQRTESLASSNEGCTESWEFRSALEAPIAKLESLDEIDSQVIFLDIYFWHTNVYFHY